MKKSIILCLLVFMFVKTEAQDYSRKEIICPSILEFIPPQAYFEGDMEVLVSFSGVPILRFEKASFTNKQLKCTYADSFASNGLTYISGLVYAFAKIQDKEKVPHEILLTLEDSFLQSWNSSRKTVKSRSIKRGIMVYTIDQNARHADDQGGVFFDFKYEGKVIELTQKFDGYAILNQAENGFVISNNKLNLVTPMANPELNVIQKKKPKRKIKNKE